MKSSVVYRWSFFIFLFIGFYANGYAQNNFHRTLGNSNTIEIFGADTTNDNHFITTGRIITGGGTSLLFASKIRLNASGDTIVRWQRRYSPSNDGSQSAGQAVITDADGNYIIVGYHKPTNLAEQIFVGKANPNGNWIWRNNYGSPNLNGRGLCITENKLDTSYIIGGYQENVAGNKDGIILHINKNGTLRYSQRIGSTQEDIITGIFNMGLHGVAVGYTNVNGNYDAWTFRYETAPFLVNNIRTIGTAQDEKVNGVVGPTLTSSSNTVFHSMHMVGTHTNAQGNKDVMAIAYNFMNNTIESAVRLSSPQDDEGTCISYVLSTGTIIGGTTKAIGDTNRDAFVLMTGFPALNGIETIQKVGICGKDEAIYAVTNKKQSHLLAVGSSNTYATNNIKRGYFLKSQGFNIDFGCKQNNFNELTYNTLAATSQSAISQFTTTDITSSTNVTNNIGNNLLGESHITQNVCNQTINCTNFTVSLGKDTLVCGANSYTLNANFPCATYLWSNNATTPSITVTQSGTYWVQVQYENCIARDTVVVTIGSNATTAGNSTSLWYFGEGAGLSFNVSPTAVLNNGATNTTQATSVMCDATGNLLFYADTKVYNKNHQVMAGSTGMNSNATQPQIAVPVPNQSNKYRIFHIRNIAGLFYTEIDLSLNNGLGGVTSENNNISAVSASQQLAATGDDNGGVWIVYHARGNNQLRAYRYTSSGIGNAVISSIGANHSNDVESDEGFLKFSPNGSRACITNITNGTVELLNFNKTTGQFSNLINLSVTNPFGVEFSPDGTKLYVSTRNATQIFQFNLSAGNAAAINASRVQIGTLPANANPTYLEALLRGQDGRIYVSHKKYEENFLSVISNPNSIGTASNFVYKAIDLGSKKTVTSLPNIPVNLFTPSSNIPVTFTYSDTCAGTSTQFAHTAGNNVPVVWNFGNPASGSANTSTLPNPQHTYHTAGTYQVLLIILRTCGNDTIKKTITILPRPTKPFSSSDTVICGNSFTLNAKNAGASYQWSTGQVSQTINVTTAGLYSVIINLNGCTNSDSVNISFSPSPQAPDFTISGSCEGSPTNFMAVNANPNFTYTWKFHDNQTATGLTASKIYNTAGNYNVKLVVSSPSCGKDSITKQANIAPLPPINLKNIDTCLQEGAVITLQAFPQGQTFFFQWSTGAGTPTINVTESSVIWLTLTKDNCTSRDTATITIRRPPVRNFTFRNNCVTDPIVFNATQPRPDHVYTWRFGNGQTATGASVTHLYSSPNTYSVTMKYDGFCGKDSITKDVTVLPGATVTIEGAEERVLCEGQNLILTALADTGVSLLWSSGQTSKSITVTSGGKYIVRAQRGSCTSIDSVRVNFRPAGNFDITATPVSTVICPLRNELITLTLPTVITNFPQFTWVNPSSSSKSIDVTQAGTYTAEALDQFGCKTTKSITIKELCETTLFVPRAFSPNGDNKNEEFTIFGQNIQKFEIRIYNRWGELVFYSDDINKRWDGKLLGVLVPSGTYVWTIQYEGEFADGKRQKTEKGEVVVLY
jgi:gliding motility-associated-like protein